MKIYYVSNLVDEETFNKTYIGSFKPGQQAQKFNRLLVEGLMNNNQNITCYSAIPLSRKITGRFFIKLKNTKHFVYQFAINIPGALNLFYLFNSFVYALTHFKKNDIVVFDILSINNSFGVNLAKKIKKFKTISLITDFPEFVVDNNLFIKMSYKIIKDSEAYIVLTKDMYERLNTTKPYTLIDGMCDVNQLSEKFTFQQKEKVIMYAGSLDSKNGIDNLVEAFIEIDNPEFILEIYGNGNYEKELISISKTHPTIKFLGVKENKYIVQRLREVSLLINPRPVDQDFTKYSFPSKILEYMSSGTPLLTTKLPGISDDYKSSLIYFKSSDKEGLKEKLSWAIDNVLSLQELGIRAREFALKEKNNNIQAKNAITLMNTLNNKIKPSIVSINLANYGSTGKIVKGIHKVAENNEFDTYFAYPYSDNTNYEKNDILLSNKFQRLLYWYLSSLTGYSGFPAYFSTKKLVKKIECINPDIIHLHNIHGHYINLKVLFNYLSKSNKKVIWTLHDCWSFTGQCSYFDMVKCEKWKTRCHHCPQIREYPQAFVDKTKEMYKIKKQLFTSVKDLTLVTPSIWLKSLVSESYLKNKPCLVINNGIDLTVFKPQNSNFREKFNLQGKKIVLAVALGWDKRKGLDVIINLSKKLKENYQIVIIGTSDEVDKMLPSNIISIHRTSNQIELAEIYSTADVFINPTREDNYPTVNMECLACGTPIITFDTGGSPEIIDDKTGVVVPVDDIDMMERKIYEICELHTINRNDCINRSKEFDQHERFKEYINLYKGSIF